MPLTGIDLRSLAHQERCLHHWSTKEPVVFSDPITMVTNVVTFVRSFIHARNVS